MQRLHLDDPVGHLLGRENWYQLNLPAIAEVAAGRSKPSIGRAGQASRC
jgi:hypothetical protein